jgi:ligand-binding sensor domain-containing protein
MKVKPFISLFFCIYSFSLSYAQDFHFETLTTKDGLSSNVVGLLYEDRDHFLWAGTRDGLNRFDGRRFQTFRNNPDDTNSLSGNVAADIIQDNEGIFWIATKDGGLTRYDEKATYSKRFKQFRNNPKDKKSIATNRLNCLYDWDSTYLVIGAEQFPAIFINKKTFDITYWNFNDKIFNPYKGSTTPLGTENWIQHIEEHEGKVYFSILTNGQMFRVDKSTGQMESMCNTESITSSIADFFISGDKIWMAGWNPGLFFKDNNPTSAIKKGEGIDDMLMCVTNYNQLYMLAGGRGSGLYRVNKNNGVVKEYKRKIGQPGSLPSNKVYDLLKDSRGILWVATSAGLAKYDPKVWLFNEAEFVDLETDLPILHTHRFNDGSVAVNTSRGMYLSDAFQFEFDYINFVNRGKSVYPDVMYQLPDSTFLIGSEAGFYGWEMGSRHLKELNVKLGSTDFYNIEVYEVKDILPDVVNGNHGYWMAVLGDGLAFYSTDDKNLYSFISEKSKPNAIGNNLASQVMLDKQGNLWIATQVGLYMRRKNTPLSENTFTGFVNEPGNKTSIPGNQINGLWCDVLNRIWFNVRGRGLCVYDKGKFTLYTPETTGSSLDFWGIHADKRNRLWILTGNGIEVFNLQQKKFFHLNINDGSANSIVGGQFSNETNGEVSFAAGNRVFTFKPDAIKFETNFPQVYLAGMNVLGKEYSYEAANGIVKLKTRERFVDFTVSALQFISPKSIRFQYRLDGLGEEWNNSDDGQIKYTNLPWGHYQLMVRVTNPAGQFGSETMLAEFVIATPFYYTLWFISLCILFIATLAYSFYRYRIAQLMQLQAIRNKIARDLHDDIGSTLGSISVFSEAAKQLLAQNNTERAQSMLGKIGDTSREMVDNMSDIVWSVNPKNDTAKYLVERMRVFAGDLVASSEIQLHFNAAQNVEDTKLTMEQRKNIFLIFKETVYNTIKYSGGSNLYIDIKRDHKNVLLIIKDDGNGFDVNNYRAEEVGAKFNIESSDKGTITSVTI